MTRSPPSTRGRDRLSPFRRLEVLRPTSLARGRTGLAPSADHPEARRCRKSGRPHRGRRQTTVKSVGLTDASLFDVEPSLDGAADHAPGEGPPPGSARRLALDPLAALIYGGAERPSEWVAAPVRVEDRPSFCPAGARPGAYASSGQGVTQVSAPTVVSIRATSNRLVLTTVCRAATTRGSNWVPAQRSSSASASGSDIAGR
jgi:hypothetical protein